MLVQSKVIQYLMERGLISAASAVEGDLVVLDASRRNHNFKVISQRGPSYLLKQGVGPNKTATVANESAIYKCLQSHAGDNGLERYLPYFYGYDAEEGILILELLNGARTLFEYHAHCGRFSTGLAMKTGGALGTLHRVTWMEGKEGQGILGFTHEPPWILSLHHPRLGMLRDISSANIQLIKIIQQFGEFHELFDRLRQEWKSEALIHFDIKWDNCIVSALSAAGRKNQLKIVDWELAGIGDPCWDVGSVFNDYLGFWLLSIPIIGETPPDRFLELARYPLVKMQPAIRSFWQSYMRQMELDAAESDEWLLRAVRYAAVRLVQTAFEQMQMSFQLTGNVVCFLQLCLNILQRPEEAITHLLGIPLQGLALP
jgi:thiamine kinase-like enzyme